MEARFRGSERVRDSGCIWVACVHTLTNTLTHTLTHTHTPASYWERLLSPSVVNVDHGMPMCPYTGSRSLPGTKA